jgi:hypothetical protein
MSSEEIQKQTASEPLTLAEEYEMQRSWQADEDSERRRCGDYFCLNTYSSSTRTELTFIVLARGEEQVESPSEVLKSCTMAGDVNLFVSERHQEDDESEQHATPAIDAELEVMIAGETEKPVLCSSSDVSLAQYTIVLSSSESEWRKKGLALEALSLLMHYASNYPTPTPPSATPSNATSPSSKYLPLPSGAFLVKIGVENEPSIRLFERLGFQEVKRSTIWNEVEMRPVDKGVHLKSITGPSAVLRWSLSS